VLIRTAVLDLDIVAAKRISGAHFGAIVDEREAADTLEEEVVGQTILGLAAILARLPRTVVAAHLERIGVTAVLTSRARVFRWRRVVGERKWQGRYEQRYIREESHCYGGLGSRI
jgi:hypothetical protein